MMNVKWLPDEIVQALEQIVQAFRERVGAAPEPRLPVDIPVWPGTVMGRLTREEIYER